MKRYCLKQDEDTHWYLIDSELSSIFDEECDRGYRYDDFTKFNELFDNCRINGTQTLSFTDPKEDL